MHGYNGQLKERIDLHKIMNDIDELHSHFLNLSRSLNNRLDACIFNEFMTIAESFENCKEKIKSDLSS